MLASRYLPEQFKAWNAKVGAPFGEPYFCFEFNNSTREFEYPWAFYAAPLEKGHRVLEIGGALSGFQFVLSALGCRVVNVDPGRPASGKVTACDEATISMLNQRLGTSVELCRTTFEQAVLQPNSFDRIFAISVIEHIPEHCIPEVMHNAYQCLKPGGYFIVTIDLFLNLHPFTSRRENDHGTNIDVKHLIETAPFELALGEISQLHGFPEFDTDRIQSRLDSYYYGIGYPTLIQCFILKKSR